MTESVAEIYNRIITSLNGTMTSRFSPSQRIPPCVGLRSDITESNLWYKTSDGLNICQYCFENFRSELNNPVLNRYLDPCDYVCESFITLNKMDNGIFNVSLWDNDLKSYYKSDSEKHISLRPGKYRLYFMYHYHKFEDVIKPQGIVDRCFDVKVKIGDNIIYQSKGKVLQSCLSKPFIIKNSDIEKGKKLDISINVYNILNKGDHSAKLLTFVNSEGKISLFHNKGLIYYYNYPTQNYILLDHKYSIVKYTTKPINMSYYLQPAELAT
jgi:hypothetical protein